MGWDREVTMVRKSGRCNGVLSFAVAWACAGCNPSEQVGETAGALQLAASSHTLTLETPRNVSIAAIALGAEHSLALEQRSKVSAHPGSGVAILSNMGEAGTTLRKEARAETIYGKSKVTLESGARLANDLFAPEAVMSDDAVRGTVNVPFDVGPATEISINVQFPEGPATSIRLAKHRKRELRPGRYAALEISGTLKLFSGTYYFESLEVTETGVLDLEQRTSPTMIFVRGQTKFFGRVRHEHAQELGIVQIGTAAASIAGQFEGAFLAPNASLELGTDRSSHPRESDHSGGFWQWWGSRSGGHGKSPGNHDDDHGDEQGEGHCERDHDHDHDHGDAHGQDEHDSLKGTFYGKSVRVHKGERVVFKRSKVLGPLLHPNNPQACVDLIMPPASPASSKQELAYQRDIGRYCSMLGTDECTIQLTSRVNLDYTALAVGIIGERLTPAQYLQTVRDRTRKSGPRRTTPPSPLRCALVVTQMAI